MKWSHCFLYLLLCLFVLVPACRDDKGEKDYSGVSELISQRNKARFNAAKNSTKNHDKAKKTQVNQNNFSKAASTSKTEELSSIVLYEQDVKIVASKSNQTLAKGVAYMNKKGQIVRIKILKK